MHDMTDTQRLTAVNAQRVELRDGLWAPRQRMNHHVTLQRLLEHIYETGRVDNFWKAAGKKSGEFTGRLYNDSDVYKWIEAAARSLMLFSDAKLEQAVEEVVDAVEAAQQADGYLNTYFTLVEPELRWTNLNFMHELFCAGHLIQAAIALDAATGKGRLLAVARRFADHIDARFGPEKQHGYPGHQEIEPALVELSRYTAEPRYRALAEYFINARGGADSPFARELTQASQESGTVAGGKVDSYPDFWKHTRTLFLDDAGRYDGSYAQDHAPVRRQRSAEGHAVRAMYLYCGMADLVAESGDGELVDALEAIWRDIAGSKVYVTGGIGSSHQNEGFTEAFDLPNRGAYSETCASVGAVMWNHRMWAISRDGAYVDMIERVLYNAFLAGVSTDGERFFYVNPLESAGDHHRRPWFQCACCPPNASRLIASLGEYLYSTDGNELYVNLYIASRAELTLAGSRIVIVQDHDYPWNGQLKIDITVDQPTEATLWLRIPAWAQRHELHAGSEQIREPARRGYVPIRRTWNGTTTIALTLPMPPRYLKSDPRVADNRGKVALSRGPLIYCAEHADNGFELSSLQVDISVEPESSRITDGSLPDGTVVLDGSATLYPAGQGRLYEEAMSGRSQPVRFRAIPYFEWDNREPGPMQVWLGACLR